MSRITLSNAAEESYEVKKSVFIANAKPVNSAEEAMEFVDEIRRKYPDARHNVYAWIVKGEVLMQKYSDDGEPSGTGGLPVLSVLTKNDITDAAVVVTRYFGGILLGKGGLIRAYTKAAALAVREANPMTLEMCIRFAVEVDYKMSEKLIYDIRTNDYLIENIEYGAGVIAYCLIPSYKGEEFVDFIVNRSNGRVEPIKLEEIEAPSSVVNIAIDNIEDEEVEDD